MNDRVALGDATSWRLILVVACVTAVGYGVNSAPTIDRIIAISSRPFSTQDTGDFLVNSPLIPLLLAPLQISDRTAFAVFSLLISMIFLAIALTLARTRLGNHEAQVIALVVVLSPAFTVSLAWLGMYDLVTVSLTIMWMVTSHRPTLVMVGAMLGFNHTEQGVVLLLIIATGFLFGLGLVEASRSQSKVAGFLDTVSWRALGLAAGGLILRWYHTVSGNPVSRSEYIGLRGLARYVGNFAQHGALIPITGFGSLLVLVAGAAITGESRHRRGILVTTSIALIVTFVTLDSTRVMAVLSLPVAVWAAITSSRRLSTVILPRKYILSALAIAIAWPRVVIWDGRAHLGAWETIFG